jgi:hypothetical protein
MEQSPEEEISKENVARLEEIEAAQQEMTKLLNDAENLLKEDDDEKAEEGES